MLDKRVCVCVCAMFMDLWRITPLFNDFQVRDVQYFIEYSSVYEKLFNKKKQRVQVNSNFSTWINIIPTLPQGSILGLLLFNFFINDLFLFVANSHLSNYPDDNTLYALGYNLEEINNILRFGFELVWEWLVVLCYSKNLHLSLYACICLNFYLIFRSFLF